MTRRSLCSLVLAAGLLGALVATGAPAQTPKRGGVLNAMLIENPPGFSIHESATIAGVWPVAPCYSNLVIFDPLKPVESDRHRHRRARREVVVAGQLPEPRVLPASQREVARRPAVHLQGRQAHVRRRPRVARRGGQAPAESAQGVVRQRRGHRGARAAHRGVPPQAATALAPAHARLRLLAGVPGPRAAERSAPALRGHRAVPAQAVHARDDGRAGAQPRLLRPRPAVPRRHQVPGHHRARHAAGRAADGPPRRLAAARDDEDHGRHAQAGGAVAGGQRHRAERQRQRADQPQEAALRQPERAPRDQPGHGPLRLRAGRPSQRRHRRRRADAAAPGHLGPARAGAEAPAGLPGGRARQGRSAQAAHRRRRRAPASRCGSS